MYIQLTCLNNCRFLSQKILCFIIIGIKIATKLILQSHENIIFSRAAVSITTAKQKNRLFSIGYKKRYHFPAKNVQKRYQIEGVLAYNTADKYSSMEAA